MNRAEFRREFPVEVPPAIVRADGSISRAALKWRLSACGCPLGNVDVAVAVLKAGGSQTSAIALAMLAAYCGDDANRGGPSIHCMERTSASLLHFARVKHAALHPWGKEAEDQAARIEHRESRWGTGAFHRGHGNHVRTNWYPYAPHGPVQL